MRRHVIGVELVMLKPGHVVQTVNPVKNLKEIVTMMTNVTIHLYVERTIVFLSIPILIQQPTVAFNLVQVRIMIKETILIKK